MSRCEAERWGMTIQGEIDQLYGRQKPEIRALGERVRELVLSIQPDLQEDVSLKLGILYFKHNGVVCALSMHQAHVNLHFYRGVELSDPGGVLQGSGKKLRHLKFTVSGEIDQEELARLVKEAYALNTT